MASDPLQPIILDVQARTKDAEATFSAMAAKIKKLAKEMNATLSQVGYAMGQANPELIPFITRAVKALQEEEKATNKVTEAKRKDALAQAELNARMLAGTASIKEYAASMKLSPKSSQALGGILPTSMQTHGMVNSVKTAMQEIMTVLKVNSNTAKKILHEMFGDRIPLPALNQAEKESNNKLVGIGERIREVFTDMRSAVQTAFGTLFAVAIFNAVQLVQEFFSDSLKLARDFEREVRELGLAEALLSKSGMDITRKELDDLVSYIENKYKYLSKVEATGVIGSLSIVKDYGLKKEDLRNLADVISYMTIQAKLNGEEIDAQRLLNALLDGRANALNQYGINLSDVVIEQKAEELQMKKVNGEYSKQDKLLATIAVAQESTSDNVKEFTAGLDGSREGMEAFNKVALDNMKLEIGQWFLDMEFSVLKAVSSIRILNSSLTGLIEKRTGLKNLGKEDGFFEQIGDILVPMEQLLAFLKSIATIMATVWAGIISLWAGAGWRRAGEAMGEAFISGFSDVIATALAGEEGRLATWTKKQWKSITGVDLDQTNATDTPTGKAPIGMEEAGGSLEKDQEKLQEALSKMNEDILDAQLKLAQDMEDAAIDLGRKLVDIDTEYANKRADAQRDYTNSVSDINRDYQNTIADIKRDEAESDAQAKNDAIDREAQFQNEMKELQEGFLMDLDDALHARDARAILKLIKQYNLDKLQAERKHSLEQDSAKREEQLRKQSFERKRADAERERKEKLADAARDYAEKLAQLARDSAAERSAAQLDYRRKLEDLQKATRERLETIHRGLMREFDLTRAGLTAIMSLYRSHYAAIQQMASSTASALSTKPTSGTTINALGGVGGSGATAGTSTKPWWQMAEGGTIIADSPTNVQFGERGLEMATFTPIGRNGRDTNRLFSSLSSGEAGAGKVSIELLLSPDLESRIVSNTLNRTAEVISKVQRSKR